MDKKELDLAKRLVSLKNWTWIPGMLAWRKTHRNEWVQVRCVEGLGAHTELADPKVLERTTSKTLIMEAGHTVVDGWHRVEDLLPDLTDPATIGCLIFLVRQAWGDPTISTAATREKDGLRGWIMESWDPRSPINNIGPFPIEVEALLIGLELAP